MIYGYYFNLAKYPKISEVKLLYHKHGQIVNYQYGKKGSILTSMNTSHLSLDTPKYYGFKTKDNTFLVSGLLSKNVEIFTNEKCCTIIPNTKADDYKFYPFEIESLRFGVGIRVLDFIWITRGSIFIQTSKGVSLYWKCNIKVFDRLS